MTKKKKTKQKHELLYIMSPKCGWCKKADPIVDELKKKYDIKTVDITKEHFSDYEKNVQVNTSVIDYHLGNMNIAFQELISQIGSHSKMYLSNITPKGVGKVLFSEDVASSTDERIINLHASILMNERANENNSQLKFRYSSNSLEHDETEEKIPVLVDVWYSHHEEHGAGGLYKVIVHFDDESEETFYSLDDAEAKYDLEGVEREETEFDVS